MKKRITALVLTLFFVFGLVACSRTDKTDNTSGTQATSTVTANIPGDAEDNIEIREFPLTVNGAGEYGKLTEAELPKRNILTEKSTLADFYPIYVDKYPIHPIEGPQYKLSNDDFSIMETELKEFLPHLYDKTIAESLEIETTDDLTVYTELVVKCNNVSVRARKPGQIYLLISNYVLSSDEVLNAFADNEYIRAAISYMGFNTPIIAGYSRRVDNMASTFIIKDDFSDDSVFTNDRYISVNIQESSNRTIIWMNEDKFETNDSLNIDTVSYDAALEYIGTAYPDTDMSEVVCEAVYDNTIYTGYFVPVYKIYVPDGNGEYTATRILAVDFDGSIT